MAKVKFSIRGKQNPASIYVRLRAGRNIDVKCKTRFVVDPKRWSIAKGVVKNPNDADLKVLNEDLLDLERDIIKLYNSTDPNDIDAQWLNNFLYPPVEEKVIPEGLVDYFDTYKAYKEKEVSSASITKLMVNKHLLEKFQKHRKKKILIKDVDANFKIEFEAYCRDKKYAQNTIARSIRFIKTICYHARNNGIETSYQLNGITSKNEKIEKIYLTPEELITLEKVELEHEYQENARDWLLISCETGQRVSDFMRFEKSMIRLQKTADGQKNISLIEFTQQKTQKLMSIPLSKRVKQILKKRGGNFPRATSSVKYNLYIKEVCKKAKIEHEISGSKIDSDTGRKTSGVFPKHELVTSHIGRRTFATNNYGKIPTPLLMSATGHTTEKMFLEYIGKTEMDRAMQLAEYFA